MKMTRKNSSSSSNKGRASGVSTMRYLTLIVALGPSVAAFSGLQNRVITKAASSGYQDPHSHPPRSERRKFTSSGTRLHYISGANPEHTAQNISDKEGHGGNTWWTSIFGREQSSAADDYLEFLDRRYNRILKDDGEDNTDKGGFSVMNWLYQGKNNNRHDTVREEDALYVLGVANLASKKFLQKHHLPAPEQVTVEATRKQEDKSRQKVVVDAEIVKGQPTTTTTPVPVAAVVALFRRVARRREEFVERQNKSIRLAMACVIQSVVTSPMRAAKALHKLFIMGGGKKTMAMTFAAMAALSFLLRPVLKVAATTTANAATGTSTMRP